MNMASPIVAPDRPTNQSMTLCLINEIEHNIVSIKAFHETKLNMWYVWSTSILFVDDKSGRIYLK